MLRKLLYAVLIALLTTAGFVIPDRYIDLAVTAIAGPREDVSPLPLRIDVNWLPINYDFSVDWFAVNSVGADKLRTIGGAPQAPSSFFKDASSAVMPCGVRKHEPPLLVVA